MWWNSRPEHFIWRKHIFYTRLYQFGLAHRTHPTVISFLVIDSPTFYHLLLGRPWIISIASSPLTITNASRPSTDAKENIWTVLRCLSEKMEYFFWGSLLWWTRKGWRSNFCLLSRCATAKMENSWQANTKSWWESVYLHQSLQSSRKVRPNEK